MVKKITIEDFFHYRKQFPVIDVRSPSEFNKGHIPGAYNIPLFNDEERAEVGTVYKQNGKEKAIKLGYRIVSPKLVSFSKQGEQIAGKEKGLVVHCWRGGMRSENMAWLFSRSGIECFVLEGGYRAYRRYGRGKLQKPLPLIVLGGMTGSGKTDILHEMEKSGEQVLNIEKLAFHKGSAFGAIGQPSQYKNEHFENLLFEKLLNFDRQKPIWVEDESRQIGRNALPDELYAQMRQCQVLKILLPKKERIKRLVRDYASYDNSQIIEAIRKVKKRLGDQNAREAIDALENNDYETAVNILLSYYDKAYKHGLSKRDPSKIFAVSLDEDNPHENAKGILDFAKEHFFIFQSRMAG
ncbi:MAG: tRNA 2-selenouridine(34) synthase MnmH [Bacteroidota bacterium]